MALDQIKSQFLELYFYSLEVDLPQWVLEKEEYHSPFYNRDTENRYSDGMNEKCFRFVYIASVGAEVKFYSRSELNMKLPNSANPWSRKRKLQKSLAPIHHQRVENSGAYFESSLRRS